MSLKKQSLIAGILYLSLAVIGPIGLMVLPSPFLTSGNQEAYVMDNLNILFLWFVVEILIVGIEIFLTYYLWKIFNNYHKKLSLYAYISRMAMIVIMIVNAGMLLALFVRQGSAAENLLNLHTSIVYIWQALFAAHVVLIGYIVYRYVSGLWKYLGIALIFGALGYALDSWNNLTYLSPAFLTGLASTLLVFVIIGEIGMAIALLANRILPSKT